MATVSPDLHDTSPAATDPAPAPYTVPPRTVRTLIGPGGALAALLGIAGAAVAGLPVLMVHAALALIAPACLGIYMARVDRAHRLIPNWAVAALGAINLGAAVGLLVTGYGAWALQGLVVTVIAAVVLMVMHLIGGTGMGDVKLVTVAALAIGVHGPGAWVLAILASYVLAALFGAVPALLRGQRKTRVPMAPYLVAGHVLALLAVLGYLAS